MLEGARRHDRRGAQRRVRPPRDGRAIPPRGGAPPRRHGRGGGAPPRRVIGARRAGACHRRGGRIYRADLKTACGGFGRVGTLAASSGWALALSPQRIETGKECGMSVPDFTLRQLLEAGVHFGHQTHRWNPRMGQYIYGARNNIHILDLTQTSPLLHQALVAVRDCVAKGGRILFVGTKRQAQAPVADAAERCAQYFMNHRWLGGTLTNWKTVSNSIERLRQLDDKLSDGASGFTKKERLNMEREQTKLQASLGGIREMGGVPDMIFVIDTNKEQLAIAEARKLGIPVVAVLDTNSDPVGIDHPIPGNDDASRAISLYCDLIARAALDGMAAQLGEAGFDLGELEDAPVEEGFESEPAAEPAIEPAAEPTAETAPVVS